MEESSNGKTGFGAEQGAMIAMAAAVVFALFFASAGLGRSRTSIPANWKGVTGSHKGVAFQIFLPEDVVLSGGDDVNAGWIDRGTLKFEIHRENVRLGFLDIDVPSPKMHHHYAATWQSLEVAKGGGAIVFRFRHPAGDGEAGSLMKRIAESIRVLSDKPVRD
ncbi:MAG: hypothetical protein ACYS47_12655 [Planctomycetota bacterium]